MVDTADVTEVTTRPGELPATRSAWVIREERYGEPIDALQLEEVEVPEPGTFEVIVRVMAAGVNYNNVWAAMGEPVSVMGFGDHQEFGHRIGGSDASGAVWKVGPGVTPVLWRTLGYDGVAEARQLVKENKHLGKISVLVGAQNAGDGRTEDGPGAIYAEVGA